jgi:hypothetical protein
LRFLDIQYKIPPPGNHLKLTAGVKKRSTFFIQGRAGVSALGYDLGAREEASMVDAGRHQSGVVAQSLQLPTE